MNWIVAKIIRTEGQCRMGIYHMPCLLEISMKFLVVVEDVLNAMRGSVVEVVP